MKKPRLFTPSQRPLATPGSGRRVLRRPDLRTLHTPRPSGATLASEIDHDELVIHRAYRVYDDAPTHTGAEVRYFVFEFSQRNPGDTEWFSGFKVVRLLRLTRVPRYLRGGGQGGLNLVFQQQRDVLAALREQQVLFLNLIAHAPDMPLAFCYGTQAVGATFEDAAAAADESFDVLRYQLMGTYQQLKVSPLTVDEGEKISQYQAEWTNIAMARGRPLPNGGSVPMMGDLDGNRTEAANNQMEAFIRGMSGSSFMLSLVTVPLSPAEMTMAWRNLSAKLSEVRSDQQGARAINAGVALPLAMGSTFGESHGDTHSTSTSEAVGDSYGVSQSVSDSRTVSESAGVSQSVTDGASRSVSVGESQSVSQGVSESQSVAAGETISQGASLTESVGASESVSQGQSLTESVAASQSVSQGQSMTESVAAGESVTRSASVGESISHGQSVSESASASQSVSETTSVTEGVTRGVSLGESVSHGQSASLSQGSSISEGASLGTSLSHGQSASSSLSESFNATLTQMEGWSQSLSESLQQSFNLGSTFGDSINGGESSARNSGVTGGLLGFNGSNGVTEGSNFGSAINNSETIGTGLTGGSSQTGGVSGSQSASQSQGVTAGESVSESVTSGQSATNSVGRSESVSATQGQSSSVGRSVSESIAASQSLSQGLTHGQSLSHGMSVGESLSRGTSVSEGLSHGQSVSRGVSHGQSVTHGQAVSQGLSQGQSLSHGQSVSQGLSQGQTVSQGQSLSTGSSVGQSASATAGVSSSESASVNQSQSQAASRTAGESVGRSLTAGESAGIASNRSLSDAYMVAMSNTAANTGTLGAVPSVGVSLTRQTFDESKRLLGDVLESQMKRFVEGMESGAFLYQMFLTAPDVSTLKGAAALMKSAFWGAGTDKRIAQPFHVITEFDDPDEEARLLDHARCFTSYRRREPVTEEISPFLYSSYITPTEMAAFTHPPTANALGLEANFDSLPVLSMPSNRASRELFLGQVVDGERGEISKTRYGVDVDELTHMLITGVTGSGKTTTLLRHLTELTQVTRQVHVADPASGQVTTKDVRASVLGLDWMRNMRNLATIVDEERFRFYSVSRPEMGAFRWNLLAIPAAGMSAAEWLNQQADNMVASWNLGEFGRSLIAEFLGDLYAANRLEPYVLLDAQVDEDGNILRDGIVLDPVDRASLPEGAIDIGANGTEYANVYSCPELSRLVSIEHLATLVMAKVEQMRDPDAARLYGTSMRDRLQSLWRRISYFAPGGVLNDLFGCDETLTERTTLTVDDLIDPDAGKIVIIETDGLDMANRRLILGSVLLAVYRYGLAHGEGVFDHDGQGPGLHVILEEAHELFGEGGEDDDSFSVATRNSLYESLFRRARALGARLVAVAQNPGHLPVAVTSNTSTVLVHRCYDTNDRKRIFDLLNWNNQVGQQQREWRFLGEMPVGWCIARLHARDSYLESAPVLLKSELAPVERITDAEMVERAARLGTQG